MVAHLRAPAAALLVVAAFASGCVVNPVSGKPEVSVTSPQEEEELGRKGDEQVAAEMGIVEAGPLASYVSSVGQRVARESPRRDVRYRFQIVDLPEPNAFALPGGYVYVSRGILALANSEAELAGVLAHEVAHVAARHAAQRQTRAVGVGMLALPGLLAGSIVGGPLGQVIAAPFAVAGKGVLASYGRDQENEADRVGQEMVARAGIDPSGLASFLGSLERYERLQTGESRRPGFFDTHPLTPERVLRTSDRVAQLDWQPSAALARPAFLRRIEGMVVGDNPAQGVFEQTRFLHPDLDFTVVFPEGWETANSSRAVGAVSEQQEAQVVLEVQGEGSDAHAAGRQLLDELAQRTRYQLVEEATIQVAGRPAYRARIVATSRAIDFTWISHRGAIYRLVGTTHARDVEAARGTFGAVAGSFRPLTPAERDGIRGDRLRIAEARAGESLTELSTRTGSVWNGPEIAVANELADGERLARGQLVKVAISEPYR